MHLQELKRREDAVQRGLPIFYTCSKSSNEANVPWILHKNELPALFWQLELL